MHDPLAVRRAALRRMIERLKRLYAGLQDDGTRVSSNCKRTLKQLRSDVESANSQSKLRLVREVCEVMLKAAAAEVIKRIFETRNCLITAFVARSCSYDSGRGYQILTPGCRPDAA